MPSVWFRHDASLGHDIPGHPERPERIRALEAEMGRHGWFGAQVLDAPRVDRELLGVVHPERYVAAIEGAVRARRRVARPDTAAAEDTWEAALRAAGARGRSWTRCSAVRRVGVSALRPPGHHAEPARAMGFCLFGNAAVAADARGPRTGSRGC